MTTLRHWTPAAPWLALELGRRGLRVTLDRGAERAVSLAESSGPDDRARAEHVSGSHEPWVRLRLRGRRATVRLEPPVVEGCRWRRDWVLELTRGAEVWHLGVDEPPATIDLAGRAPIEVRLVVRPRFLLAGHPSEGVRVRLEDRAFFCHTRQSSAQSLPVTDGLRWAPPTMAEPFPFWEIDLGATCFLPGLAVDLLDPPRDAALRLVAFEYPSPDGEPPVASPRLSIALADHPPDEHGLVRVAVNPGWVARHVRVELACPAGQEAALTVAGCELPGATLRGDTLRDTWRRTLALHHDRAMVLEQTDPGGPFAPRLRYREAARQRAWLARALAHRLEPGAPGRVFLALLTRNRVEWLLTDLAAVERGHVVVPLSPHESDERLESVLGRCQPAAMLVEARDARRLGRLARRACPALRLLIVCDDPPGDEPPADDPAGGAPDPAGGGGEGEPLERIAFDVLLREGEQAEEPPAAAYSEDDLYTLLFTSGSTGAPKGAMRSYRTFHAMLGSYGVAQPALHLSFQPLSHISERMYLPAVLLHGGAVAFSRGPAHLRRELRAFAPTDLGAVPRLFDVLHAEYLRRRREAERAPEAGRAALLDRARAEARAAFGDRLTVLSVGSAPVSPAVLSFLRETFADIWVLEGYGTTEVGTIASDGQAARGVSIKLVPLPDDPSRGEIWVRTPHMIDGYFGDPAATAAALDAEGYFRTGDLGERSADGAVRVIGRRQSAVKLAHGEFVAPEPIETALATSPLVDRVLVHVAPGAPGAAALVFPRRDELAARLALPDASLSALVAHPAAAPLLLAALRRHGREAGLAAHELPASVVLEATPPSVEQGTLTTSGKIARAALIALHGLRLEASAGAGAADLSVGSTDRPRPSDEPTAPVDLAERLARVASSLLARPVTPAEPLVDALDSLGAAALLAALTEELGRPIPLPSWFASRSLDELAARLRPAGAPAPSALVDEAVRELARPLELPAASAAPRPLRAVLLTGATGFLGAHLLEELLDATALRVVCLVRGAGDGEARERLARACLDLGVEAAGAALAGPPAGAGLAGGGRPGDPLADRVTVVAGDLAAPRLGLGEARFAELAASVDAVLHAGAAVSWLAPYAALRGANVDGTRTLLDLCARRATPLHLVSTISTVPADGDEGSRLSLAEAALSPYALSKWLSEELALQAARQGLPLAVYRPAMIAPHSARGVSNRLDFIHRYLVGSAALGRYLDLPGARLDMTPVDFVARAVVALLRSSPGGGPPVHLVNVAQSMTYAGLGRAMAAAGVPVAPSDHASFRAALLAGGERSEALRALAAYFPADGFALGMGPWPSERSRRRLEALGVRCPAIDDAMIARIVGALRARGLLGRAGPP